MILWWPGATDMIKCVLESVLWITKEKARIEGSYIPSRIKLSSKFESRRVRYEQFGRQHLPSSGHTHQLWE